MKQIKQLITIFMIIISLPFVVSGFIGTFIVGSYRIGAEFLDKFVEWVENY